MAPIKDTSSRITASEISKSIQTGSMSLEAAIDMIDEISIEVDDGYGFQYAKWRRFVCDLHGVNRGKENK